LSKVDSDKGQWKNEGDFMSAFVSIYMVVALVVCTFVVIFKVYKSFLIPDSMGMAEQMSKICL